MGRDTNRYLVPLAVCVAVLLTGRMTPRASAGPNDPSSSTTVVGGMEIFIQTDKSVYELGEEDVEVLLRLTNIGEASRELTCLQEPGWNLHAFENSGGASLSELVYGPADPIWSLHRAFKQVVWSFTLDAGESVQYDATWDMTDYDGDLVASSTYEVVGFTPGGGAGTAIVLHTPEPGTLMLLSLGVAGLLLRRVVRQ